MKKIISGGQTGVDRAALDFALKQGIPCGGWCPKGRLAEDGPIASHYPLLETKSSIYAERTRRNVDESDGTLILYADQVMGGTRYTLDYVRSRGKPFIDIPVAEKTAPIKIQNWLVENNIRVLNIAGPRESSHPGIYQKSMDLLKAVFDSKK